MKQSFRRWNPTHILGLCREPQLSYSGSDSQGIPCTVGPKPRVPEHHQALNTITPWSVIPFAHPQHRSSLTPLEM